LIINFFVHIFSISFILKVNVTHSRTDGFVAASLYAACRHLELPRPLQETTTISTRNHAEVARKYRLLIKELNIKMPIDGPMKFIPGIASKLELEPKTQQYAVELLRKAKKHLGLTGKDPRGLAATALYKASIETHDKRIRKARARCETGLGVLRVS
jgi:transcription initiation factor TFIIB